MEIQNGFTEKEVVQADEFIKFIGQHFKKEMDTTEAFKYVQLFQNMNQCLRKMHSLILEVKAIHEPEPEPKPSKRTRTKKD